MKIIFTLLLIIIFIFNMYLYFFDSNKKGILYSLIFGLLFGILSFHFIPEITYDLTKHHNVVDTIKNLSSSSNIIKYLYSIDLELLPKAISLIISCFNNHNYLQLLITSIGYFLIFYMLYDYKKNIKLKSIYSIPLVLFIIFGFHILYFFSGLYSIFSMILFSFAFYLNYIKQKNKKVVYLFYALSLLMHNSIIFPFLILLFFKLTKEKISIKTIILCIIIYYFTGTILEFIDSITSIQFISNINYMYNAYTSKNEIFIKYYSGYTYFIELSKLLFLLLLSILNSKNFKTNKKINDFIILMSVMILIMSFKSRIMIRYANLIQFIGIITIQDFFVNIRKNNILYYLLMIFLLFIYFLYFVHLLNTMNFDFFK